MHVLNSFRLGKVRSVIHLELTGFLPSPTLHIISGLKNLETITIRRLSIYGNNFRDFLILLDRISTGYGSLGYGKGLKEAKLYIDGFEDSVLNEYFRQRLNRNPRINVYFEVLPYFEYIYNPTYLHKIASTLKSSLQEIKTPHYRIIPKNAGLEINL